MKESTEKALFKREREQAKNTCEKTGISQQEERLKKAAPKKHTEGVSAIKSTEETPLKRDHGKNPAKESTEKTFGKKEKKEQV